MLRSQDNPAALGGRDTGQRPAVLIIFPLAYLDEDQSATLFPHDQIDLTTATPGGFEIACHEQ
jgi:hypothetical protein